MEHQPQRTNEPPGTRRRRRKRVELSAKQRRKIARLHRCGLGTRRIGKKLGLGRKVVRDVLAELGYLGKPAAAARAPRPASKLDAFRERIKDKASRGLTVTRILREIRAEGYTGGRTILADCVRKLRVPPAPRKKVWRRFETRPGEEAQFDWSPYRVELGGRQRVVHAFGVTLAYSRKSHVRFYFDERESTLLEAHTLAFDDFDGVAQRHVYDRMATVSLGTMGAEREVLWHPRFKEFADHYGFKPFLCKVRDPDRKGKDERIFWYLERDFLRGSTFDSLQDLNARVRLWLDEVANCRVHGTTRRVPDEVWRHEERELLIALPELRPSIADEQMRQVGPDAVISVRGTPYTVPAGLAHQKACVRLYAEHFEVLDNRGRVAWSRAYMPEGKKGRLVIDPSHYDGVRRCSAPPTGSAARLEEALLERFPTLADLVAGIKLRFKGLSHIHLRALWRLAARYGDEAFVHAASRVQAHRRHDAHAVRRLLEREHPLPDEQPHTALSAAARVVAELGEVDPGSLDDYAHLDTRPADEPGSHDPDTARNGDQDQAPGGEDGDDDAT